MYVKEPSQGRDARLVEMISRLADNPDSSHRHFDTAEELAARVGADLAILLTERFEAAKPRLERETVTPSRNSPPALPVPLTPTIGREEEVDSAAALIRSGARLVTITGVGGVGKTHVASEVVRVLHGGRERVGARRGPTRRPFALLS